MKKLLTHTVLERDIPFLTAYSEWYSSPSCRDKCAWLMNQFELYKSLPGEVDKSLRFLINQSSVGIHWNFSDSLFLEEAPFFLEFFRNRIQSTGYLKQLADKRIFETAAGLETMERYYLKPPFKLDEAEKKRQLFGNIMLSNAMVNGRYIDFQCLCHFFVDRQYTEAEPIQYLFEIILENG